MPLDKHITIMAKSTFSLLDVASAQQVPFWYTQYVQCTHHGLICPPLLYLMTVQGVDLQCSV